MNVLHLGKDKAMVCKNTQDQLYDYLTGRLDDTNRSTVAEHLHICPECRQKLDALKTTLNILDQAQPPEPSADFNDRVMRSIQEQKALKKAQDSQTAKILQFPKRERFEPSKYFEDLPMVVNRGGSAPSAEECTARAVSLYNKGTLSEDLDAKETLFLEALQAGCIDKKILAKICNNLADCYERLGRLDESIAVYTKAVELDPDLHIALLSLGDIYTLKGFLQKAIDYYVKALASLETYHQQNQIVFVDILKTKQIIENLQKQIDKLT